MQKPTSKQTRLFQAKMQRQAVCLLSCINTVRERQGKVVVAFLDFENYFKSHRSAVLLQVISLAWQTRQETVDQNEATLSTNDSNRGKSL